MKKPGRSRQSVGGFTLIEILIVILIIGMLLAIAGRNFVQARERTWKRACTKNLMTIHTAKEQFLMERNLPRSTPSSAFTDAELYGADRYIRVKPLCPAGGSYSLGDGDTFPTCDYLGGNTHFYTGE